MLFANGQSCMLGPGTAFVTGVSEKHCAPEGVHLGQMMFPVYAGDLVEDGTEQLVPAHTLVKAIDELLDVVVCGDVLQSGNV